MIDKPLLNNGDSCADLSSVVSFETIFLFVTFDVANVLTLGIGLLLVDPGPNPSDFIDFMCLNSRDAEGRDNWTNITIAGYTFLGANASGFIKPVSNDNTYIS